MQYVITLEASQDLDEIWDYFLCRNINAGSRFIWILIKSVILLNLFNTFLKITNLLLLSK